MIENDALVLVFSRNSFYKRLHFLALAAFALTVVVIISLLWVVVYLVKNPTHPLYFATDNVGRLIQVIPVNTPNMTIDKITAWAIEGVQVANSYDYVNYHAQLQSAQKYFTNYGWNNYMAALTASSNLPAIIQRKWVVIAQVVEQPKILAAGILGGAYAWKFQMSLLVSYWRPPYDEKSKFSNPLDVTVIVQRQPALQGYEGLGIVQLYENIATVPAEINPTITATPTG
jgi:intracellular multiplication protein IcmL